MTRMGNDMRAQGAPKADLAGLAGRGVDARFKRASWSGTAFLVEALVLLAFLAASLGVLSAVFITSLEDSVEAERLEAAVTLASDAAEQFAAHPLADLSGERTVNETAYQVQVQVQTLPASDAGTGFANSAPADAAAATAGAGGEAPASTGGLYCKAHITVSCEDRQVYELDTASYAGSVAVAAAAAAAAVGAGDADDVGGSADAAASADATATADGGEARHG